MLQQTATTNNYNGALQQPLHTGFSAYTTASEVMKGIDLTGKTAIVTGGYAGIGLETTKALVNAGATVWLPARDTTKAAKNVAGIPNVLVQPMDLMDPASIDSFATGFLATGNVLHLLINNAGIMWVPLRRTKQGYESQFATNHLGHFQLTAKLWPALKQAGGARVISVSSFGHQMAPFNFEDPHFEHRTYDTLQGYGQSKTANNLFAVELDRRAQAFGVRAYSLHPGSVYGTDLGREEPIDMFIAMGTYDANGVIKPEVARTLKTIPQGAATTLWCATSALLSETGGVYCEDCDIAQLDLGNIEHQYDKPATLRGVQPWSVDAGNAQRLWALSEQLTNTPFSI